MDGFTITQRQYDIIIDQVKKNFPYESGGFIGGKDHHILGVLPSFNQDISNKTDVFAIYPEDIERAHLFFQKHGLEYYGTYHSHPKGYAIPSEQDLKNIQKYLFIISLRNFDQPDFAAYKVTGIQKADRVPLKRVSNSHVEIKDIHNQKGESTKKMSFQVPDYGDEAMLNQQINNLFNQQASYKKTQRSQGESGDFSTLA